MIQHEQVLKSNFSATQGPFTLLGGYYLFLVKSGTQSGSNHVDVTILGPDGTTVFALIAGAQTGTTTEAYGYLPPGSYSFTVTGTLAGIYASVTRIPLQ